MEISLPINIWSSNISDEDLIECEQVWEGSGDEDEVGEVDEVLRELVLNDPPHPARLPADVAAI